MMVIITYDVETLDANGQRRLRRVAKECLNFGIRVQNSVFECVLDSSHALLLKSKLDSIIDKSKDSIRFYFLGNNWERHIETIGIDRGTNVTSTLII